MTSPVSSSKRFMSQRFMSQRSAPGAGSMSSLGVSAVSRRRPAAVVTLIASLVVAVLLSGCAGHESGAAAVVGDRRISVSQVQTAFADITALVGQDQQITQADILYLLIMEPTFTQAAAGAGVGVSNLDAEQQFGAVNQDGTPRFTNAATLAVLRSSFAQLKVLSAKPSAERPAYLASLNKQVKNSGLSINPRYGTTLNTTDSLGIDTVQPNWIKQPKVAAAPSAATSATPAP